MDSELRKFYQDRLSMIESDGWRELIIELDNLSEVTNNIESLNNENDLWFAKGQLSVLRQIISMESLTKSGAEELEI